MERLTLNDGQHIDNGSALDSDGALFLYMPGLTMARACGLMLDPEKTKRIVYTQVNGEDVVFTGYTKLKAVSDEDGLISAVLRRG